MPAKKHFFRALLFFLCYLPYTGTVTYAQEIDDYLLWAKVGNFPAPSQTAANQSDMDADRNLYVIGTFFKEFPWAPDPTQTIRMMQLFVRKYDTDGNLLWSKEFGNSEYYSYGGDIRVDNRGDIVFTGFLLDPDGAVLGVPVPGFFLAKMDKYGNLVWIKPFSKTSLWTWGERIEGYVKQSKMEIDKDNSIVLYSNGNPPATLPNPTFGLYISRYSSSTGDLLAQFQITRDDNFDSPGIGGIAIDNDGNFIITGYYHVSLTIGPVVFGIPGTQSDKPVHLYLAKFSSTGVFLWAKVSDGNTSIGNDIQVDELNNIYLTGLAPGHSTLGDDGKLNPNDQFFGFIAKLDSNGLIIWSKTMEGNPTSLKRTSAGDLYLTGSCIDGIRYGNNRLVRAEEQTFVLKMNSDTSFGGAIVSDGLAPSYLYKLAYNSTIDDAGNIYTIGNFHQRIVFGCDTLLSSGGDMFITKYSSLPPAYTLDINGPARLCEGATFTLTASAVSEPVKYSWTLPPGVTLTSEAGNQITASVAASANFAEVGVKIRKGCYNYESFSPYKINIQFPVGVAGISGVQTICEKGVVRYTTGSPNATEYIWSLPRGMEVEQGTLVTTDPYLDVIISEEFTGGALSVKAKNECGTGQSSIPFQVERIRKPVNVSFITPEDKFCNRGQVQTFEVTPSEGATEYVWTIPSNMQGTGVVTSTSNTIELKFGNAGLGSISVYAKNICHKTKEEVYTLEVIAPLPQPQIFKSICDRELRTDGTENVAWFKDAEKLYHYESTLTPTVEGGYYVTVSNFCGTVPSQTVDVSPVWENELLVPNIITPNNDDKNDVLILKPAMDEVFLQIFNRWGESIYKTSDYQNDWNGSGISSGIYYLQLQHPCLVKKYHSWLHVIK